MLQVGRPLHEATTGVRNVLFFPPPLLSPQQKSYGCVLNMRWPSNWHVDELILDVFTARIGTVDEPYRKKKWKKQEQIPPSPSPNP
jgi:hypothetical protein